MSIHEKARIELTKVAREAYGDPALVLTDEWFDTYRPSWGMTPHEVLTTYGEEKGVPALSDYIKAKAMGGYE